MTSCESGDIVNYGREQNVLTDAQKKSLERLEAILLANRKKFKSDDKIIGVKKPGGKTTLDAYRKQKSFEAMRSSIRHEAEQLEFATIVKSLRSTICKRALDDGDMVLSEGNILYSAPGGDRQGWHYDFPLLEYTKPPRVFIIAVSRTARLDLCKKLYLHPEDNEIILDYSLKRGDVFWFDGHLPHRGCGYDKPNFRVHFYAIHRSDEHLLDEIVGYSEIFTSSHQEVRRKKGRPKKQLSELVK
jgi:hypothetical protein